MALGASRNSTTLVPMERESRQRTWSEESPSDQFAISSAAERAEAVTVTAKAVEISRERERERKREREKRERATVF